jgi:hypothetical protein
VEPAVVGAPPVADVVAVVDVAAVLAPPVPEEVVPPRDPALVPHALAKSDTPAPITRVVASARRSDAWSMVRSLPFQATLPGDPGAGPATRRSRGLDGGPSLDDQHLLVACDDGIDELTFPQGSVKRVFKLDGNVRHTAISGAGKRVSGQRILAQVEVTAAEAGKVTLRIVEEMTGDGEKKTKDLFAAKSEVRLQIE